MMRKRHYIDPLLGLIIPGFDREMELFHSALPKRKPKTQKKFRPRETWKERKARLKAEKKAKKAS